MIILRNMIFSLFGLLGLIIVASLLTGYFLSAPGYKGPVSGHFNGNKFINPGNVEAKGFKDLLKWALNRDPGKWEKITDTEYPEKITSSIESGLRVYYVNHSTFLIQVDGLNILTDPVWSQRVSPFEWAGPQRMRPPGIRFEDLPPIHFVLISHNHYDHLDISTIQRLDNSFQPVIICPLGVSKFLNNRGIKNTRELDWWDDTVLKDNTMVSCVEAQHFSGRGMFDRDKTLWAGYVLRTSAGNIYFAGDTGYGEFFRKIKSEYGPIKLAMLPIGAYLPRWFMSPVHTSPEDAVKIHIELEAAQSIGIHYGTFPLGDDGMKEPEKDLEKAKSEYGIQNFILLKEGNHIDL